MKIDHAAAHAQSAASIRPSAAKSDGETAHVRERQPAGRRHIQRDLRHLVREIRHDIQDELVAGKKSGELDGEDVQAIKDLFQDFSAALQDAFHAAGRGHDFDPSTLAETIGASMSDLTEGLRLLREGETEEPPVEDVPPIQETDPTDPSLAPTDPAAKPDAGLLLDMLV